MRYGSIVRLQSTCNDGNFCGEFYAVQAMYGGIFCGVLIIKAQPVIIMATYAAQVVMVMFVV